MKQQSPARKIGRPLSFDREAALEQAMLAFWQHGYETTSVSDLTTAMGVTAPSLYAAFGDKKQLFLAAVQRYAGAPDDLDRRLDAAPTARQAAEAMLLAAADAFTSDLTPRGCLLASATASGSAGAQDVRNAVAQVRQGIIDSLRRRIDRDIASALLPAGTDAAGLAALVVAVVQGMSVLARDGMARVHLRSLGVGAMAAWPREALATLSEAAHGTSVPDTRGGANRPISGA
jgi:AcrR family transcriptional regulator